MQSAEAEVARNALRSAVSARIPRRNDYADIGIVIDLRHFFASALIGHVVPVGHHHRRTASHRLMIRLSIIWPLHDCPSQRDRCG